MQQVIGQCPERLVLSGAVDGSAAADQPAALRREYGFLGRGRGRSHGCRGLDAAGGVDTAPQFDYSISLRLVDGAGGIARRATD
ncbi:MAG: hypothetical protein U0521_01470 [Anaerolineae bacterium]